MPATRLRLSILIPATCAGLVAGMMFDPALIPRPPDYGVRTVCGVFIGLIAGLVIEFAWPRK